MTWRGHRFIVVAYDIRDNVRRRWVRKTLKNFGRRVQYSAFECVLDSAQFRRLQTALNRLLSADDDAVVYYLLCRECARRTVVLSGLPRLTLPRTIVV